MKLEAICHLLICTHQVSLRWSYLLNCKEVVMQQKQKVMTGASSQRWDATRLKKSSVLIMEPQLYSAQTVVKLFYLSWRLVVAKHLGAKVFIFSLSFVFICLTLSAQPWWLLLLMLSASFFLVVFSPSKPLLLLQETLNISLPVHQPFFHPEDLPDFTKFDVAMYGILSVANTQPQKLTFIHILVGRQDQHWTK